MKIEIHKKEKEFKPITVTLTLESPEETNLFAMLINERNLDEEDFGCFDFRIGITPIQFAGIKNGYNVASTILSVLAEQGYPTVTLVPPKPSTKNPTRKQPSK